MMRSKLTALCLAAMMIPGAAAAAERPTGTYLGAGAGINFADDTDISGNGINASAEHDTGYAGALSLGHAYANGIRAEVELGNRRNAIDSVDGFDTGGSANVLSAMVNTYYDFATGSAFIPYLGAGIGVGSMHLTANPVDGSAINDRGNGLALQGIAGLGYQVTENLTSTLEYRYFTVQGADLKTLGGTSIDADYQAHTVMVGLRYTFGDVKKPMPEPKPMAAAAPAPAPQPAPAPAPAPAPEITRNFIVFFDWDKADITPEAATVLRAAAEKTRALAASAAFKQPATPTARVRNSTTSSFQQSAPRLFKPNSPAKAFRSQWLLLRARANLSHWSQLQTAFVSRKIDASRSSSRKAHPYDRQIKGRNICSGLFLCVKS